MRDVFEDIESIPWADLHHARGDAADVPFLLKDLMSENGETRQEALHELLDAIWHQGTVFEATSYVIPYLASMVRSPRTPDRASVAGLLAAIANGRGYLDVDVRAATPPQDVWDEVLSKEGIDLDERVALRRCPHPHRTD